MQSVNLRQLASNFTFLTGGEIFTKICTFVAFMFLARVLGPESFGYLEFTLAAMVFFTLFVDFGTSPYGAREIAKNRNGVGELIAQVVPLRILLAATGYSLLLAFAFFAVDDDTPVRSLFIIYGLTLFLIPGFLQWVFQGLDKMKLVALGSIIRQLVFVLGIFLVVRSKEQILNVAYVECFAVGAFVLYCLVMYKSYIGRVSIKIPRSFPKVAFTQILPIGLSELTWASTWYFATILLGLMVGGKEVGWFSAAHRPIMTLHTFIWLYFYNLFPSMSRCTAESLEVMQDLMSKSIRFTTWVAIFIGTVGTILAGPMITLVFGPQYSEAISIFSILVWLLPMALLSGHYRYALIAYDQQKYELFSSASAAVVLVFTGVLLIPRFSIHGAAIALIIAKLVNWFLAYIFAREKICNFPFMMHLLRPLAAGGLMLAGFHLLHNLNVWLAATSAIIIYLSTLICLQPEVRRLLLNFDYVKSV